MKLPRLPLMPPDRSPDELARLTDAERRAYRRERRKGAAIWLLLVLTLLVGWTIPAAAGLPTLWESARHAFGAGG
jgi:hypothetical protein